MLVGVAVNATLVGLLPVVIWGAAMPFARLFQTDIGLFPYMAIAFGLSGLLGFLTQRGRREALPPACVLRVPALYARGVFFVLHEGLVTAAAGLVTRERLPLVILLNYFWPTAVILCSIAFSGVRISRLWAFGAGTLIVLASLLFETVGDSLFVLSRGVSNLDLLGCALAFVGAVSWGLYSAISRRSGDASGGGSVVPFFQLGLSVIALVCAWSGSKEHVLYVNGESLVSVFLPIVGNSLHLSLSYAAWDYSMRHGNIVYVSLFADFIPWLSLLVAVPISGITLTSRTVVSAMTLVVGAMLTRYGTSGTGR